MTFASCSEADRRFWKPTPPAQNYRNALEAASGDDRRDAVCRIAESSYVAAEDAFHVLDTVARTDSVSQVRCIAVRAFTRYPDARPVGTLLKVLRAGPQAGAPKGEGGMAPQNNAADPPTPSGTPRESLPADADVRWETVRTLFGFERRGLLTGPERDAARDILLKLLESDPSRNVRILAAETLGGFKDRQVLRPLIASLRTEDFAIAERAEHSLVMLTGSTHEYDADAWEAWLAGTEDPFANAGHTPVTTRPAGPSWFDQQIRAWRRGLKLGTVD